MLKVQRKGGETTKTTGYYLDIIKPETREELVQDLLDRGVPFKIGETIDSLIVCTKAQTTCSAIKPIVDRLRPSSVITLLQNGMGVYDELCARFWPEPSLRPQFILGTTTHGVTPGDRPGSVIHASRPGEGSIKLGVVPDPRGRTSFDRWLWGSAASNPPTVGVPSAPPLPLPKLAAEPNVRDTLEAVLSLSELNPEVVPMPTLYHELLLKLAVNATINPLTAALGGGVMRNGDLVRSSPGFQLIKQTASETSAVLTAYLRNLAGGHPPEPELLRLFSAYSLEQRIKSVATQTQDNVSSMANDVKNGRDTEIDYINGFIVALGAKLGVATPQHRMLVQMVKLKAEMAGLGQAFLPKVVQAIRHRGDHEQSSREARLEERKIALEEKRMRLERLGRRESQLEKREARRKRKAAKRRDAEERELAEARHRLLSSEMPPVDINEKAK